jgi:DNA polymerase-3 subunit alpha
MPREFAMSQFVHLHVHSHYSLLDSTIKLPSLARRVAELGMTAVAVTDHGNMFHCIEMQGLAKGSGVQPIYGVEVYVVPERKAAARPCSLVLLAETAQGYRNLIKLVSDSSRAGLDRNKRPLCDYDMLRAHAGGVIALSGDLGGEVAQALLRNQHEAAEQAALRLRDIYGEGNVFLQVERLEGLPETFDVCESVAALAARLDLPIVATNNVHYLNEGDHTAHGIVMCIGMEKRVDRQTLDKVPTRALFLRSAEQMEEIFSDLPQAISNTVRIAERCKVKIPTGTYFLPGYPVPGGDSEGVWLHTTAHHGLTDRFAEFALVDLHVDEAGYRERLDFEIEVINRMGYAGYFLIVADFINWAKKQSIPVGPGRGSGAGSLVAYCLGITDIDPIPYGLLFERFLNPERVSMPDFDIDFCQDRRGEVIKYVTDKYGADNVGQIVTFGQLKAKAVLKDVARVLNIPLAESDQMTKLIPNKPGTRLKDAYEGEPKLQALVAANETNQFLYSISLALEGNNRNTGVHAAGVVIGQGALWDYVPVLATETGELVTQYAKNEVEEAGLVKFDFLGLKTLTVIDRALKLVNGSRPADQPLDFRTVSLNDPRVYELLGTGECVGVFQLESSGFQRLMRQLKPDCFEDIVAAVAIYRPGPLGSGMVEDYVKRKNGLQKVTYQHPLLEPILRETYGVIVYQEQVMQIAQVMAGYTLGGADLLRRAMGKKKASEMEKQRADFEAGAGARGIDAELAKSVFDLMEYFAGYGFNKSHSAAYAVITFQTGYLKAHHPTQFYAASMSVDAASTTKVVRYIVDARSRGIAVLPPDVNQSQMSFSVDGNSIRFGFGAIKGVGESPISAIVEARGTGPFKSLFEFCERVDSKRVNRRVLEALISCGAFDSAHPEYRAGVESGLLAVGRWRAAMWEALDGAIERGQSHQRDKASGQSSLFGLLDAGTPTAKLPNARPWDSRDVLSREKSVLGFYVSGHPLDRYRDEVRRLSTANTSNLETHERGETVRLAAVISAHREHVLKNGGRMGFITLEDHFGEIEGLVFKKNYGVLAALCQSDEPMLVSAEIMVDEDEDGEGRTYKLAVNSLVPLAQARSSSVSAAIISLESGWVTAQRLDALRDVLIAHPGTCRPMLKVHFGMVDAIVDPAIVGGIDPSETVVQEIETLVGAYAVAFE